MKIALAGLLLLAGSSVAVAQTARSGGGEANAQLQQQLQQLASERTALQTENAKLKGEVESLRKERDALKAREQSLDAQSRSAASSAAQNERAKEATERELTQLRGRSDELVARFRETAQTLREVETESTSLRQSLATRDRELSTCIDHNVALYDLNVETLNFIEDDGFWSRLGRAEPFTQLKRVQLENQIGDYRARAEEQRVATPAASSASPGTP